MTVPFGSFSFLSFSQTEHFSSALICLDYSFMGFLPVHIGIVASFSSCCYLLFPFLFYGFFFVFIE